MSFGNRMNSFFICVIVGTSPSPTFKICFAHCRDPLPRRTLSLIVRLKEFLANSKKVIVQFKIGGSLG